MTVDHPTPERSGLLLTDEYVLKQWAGNLRNCFPHAWILHVGSSTCRRDYRDVDVRIVLDDDEYDSLSTICAPSVLSVALSYWGQQFTRLPIDCQLQRNTDQQSEKGNRGSLAGFPEPRAESTP